MVYLVQIFVTAGRRTSRVTASFHGLKGVIISSYLRDHDELGQQSWGHHPTKISIAPCVPVSGLAAKH